MKQTITTATPLEIRVGARLRLTDLRPWYVKLWHWICRRKPPQLEYFVTDAHSSTSFTVQPGAHHLPPYKSARSSVSSFFSGTLAERAELTEKEKRPGPKARP